MTNLDVLDPFRQEAIEKALERAEHALNNPARIPAAIIGGAIGGIIHPLGIGIGANVGAAIQTGRDHLTLEQVAADLGDLLRTPATFTVDL